MKSASKGSFPPPTPARRQRKRNALRRPLRFESLEDRRVLSFILEIAASGGASLTVPDNSPDDESPVLGVISVNRQVGDFSVQFTTTLSKPALGDPSKAEMVVSHAAMSTSAQGKLIVRMTDTDFSLAPLGAAQLTSDIGVVTPGTTTFQGYVDTANQEFGIAGPTVVTTGIQGPLTGADSSQKTAELYQVSPFSLTAELVIELGAGELQSLGGSVTVTPIDKPAALGNYVWLDSNGNGLQDANEPGVADVVVELLDAGMNVLSTTTTDNNGAYSFTGLAAGNYFVRFQAPTGFQFTTQGDGSNAELDSNADLLTGKSAAITLVSGQVDNTIDAGLLPIAQHLCSLSGIVYIDFNNDGLLNFGELVLKDVVITLLSESGDVVATTTTGQDGSYFFADLAAGKYFIQEQQPAGFAQGINSIGTLGGSLAAVDKFFVDLSAAGEPCDGMNYNFAERPGAGDTVRRGQAATIGYWQNKNGQALLKSLNGGQNSTQLGNWLAATFPNMYGIAAGANNLTNKTNAQVAAFYTSLFQRNAKNSPGGPPKVDAQVLATAFAVYVTNSALAGNVATNYGFSVGPTGLGYSTINVGANGAAFGLVNNSSATVLDLLLAVNARTKKGLLYDLDNSGLISASEAAQRVMCNAVFTLINEQGDI